MRQQLSMVISVVACAILLSGCGEEQAPVQPAKPRAVAKPPAVDAPVPQPGQADATPTETTKFIYQIESRRDPFVPLVATKTTAGFFENPLEAFDVPQFQVKAVILGMGETKAMVVAPDGRAYILKKGMRLGKSNGVITDITRERVLVEEQYQDLTGKVRKNMQELKVPIREGV